MRKLIFLFFLPISVYAQHLNVPINNPYFYWLDGEINQTHHHTSLKPIISSEIKFDSLLVMYENREKYKKYDKKFLNKVKNESLFRRVQDNFEFSIDPLLYAERGFNEAQDKQYINTRGIRIQSSILKKVSFMTSFYESQAFFPEYISTYALSLGQKTYPGSGVIPGQGRAKPFKDGGFDFGMSDAYVTFVPNDYLSFQTGHGKFFVGEGYRSLLLSDNAFNYPFFKVNTFIGKQKKIQYSTIYASLLGNERVPISYMPEAPFKRKGATFQFLSWKPNKYIEVSLFESTIWQIWKDTIGSLPTSIKQFNPFIGINTLINGLSSVNNTALGGNIKVSPTKHTTIYAQLLVDEKNKYGYQGGIKLFNLHGLLKNTFMQVEYNTISPNTYTHDVKLQSFTQFDQSMGHTWTNDFHEFVGIFKYHFKDVFVQTKLNSGIVNKSLNTDLQGNIFISQTELGYMINRAYNLNIVFGYFYRNMTIGSTVHQTSYYFLTLRTSLRNLYYDF
jgi:hypothetical protein